MFSAYGTENSKAGKRSDFAQVIAFNSDFKASLVSLLYLHMGFRTLFERRAVNKLFGIFGICATTSNRKYTATVNLKDQADTQPGQTGAKDDSILVSENQVPLPVATKAKLMRQLLVRKERGLFRCRLPEEMGQSYHPANLNIFVQRGLQSRHMLFFLWIQP